MSEIEQEDNWTIEIRMIRFSWYLKQFTFFDIDIDFDSALKHFASHPESIIWYRKSSSGSNHHALVSNPCRTCEAFNDKRFSQQILFNNKGFSIADVVWTNLKDESTCNFYPTTLIHFMFQIEKTFNHFYIESPYLMQYLPNILNYQDKYQVKLYYTFHSALIKFDKYFQFSMDSEGYEITLDQYIENYNFKPFQNDVNLKKTLANFLQWGIKKNILFG